MWAEGGGGLGGVELDGQTNVDFIIRLSVPYPPPAGISTDGHLAGRVGGKRRYCTKGNRLPTSEDTRGPRDKLLFFDYVPLVSCFCGDGPSRRVVHSLQLLQKLLFSEFGPYLIVLHFAVTEKSI